MAAFFTLQWSNDPLEPDLYTVLDWQGHIVTSRRGTRLSALQHLAQIEDWYWRNHRAEHMNDGLGQACPNSDEPVP